MRNGLALTLSARHFMLIWKEFVTEMSRICKKFGGMVGLRSRSGARYRSYDGQSGSNYCNSSVNVNHLQSVAGKPVIREVILFLPSQVAKSCILTPFPAGGMLTALGQTPSGRLPWLSPRVGITYAGTKP